MKRTIVTMTAVFVALGLAIFVGAPKGQNFNSTTAIAAPAPVPAAVPMPHECPNIHAAIDALKSAQHDLHVADHDFCGHKEDVERAVEGAITQLRMAENFQRCR
jgi:hypothetical protein